MQVSIHPSARKHGLTDAQIEPAWLNGHLNQCWLDDAEPQRLLRIGLDHEGIEIELVALVFDNQRALIIHAMRARSTSWTMVRQAERRAR
jgi:hypothetical protein